LKIDTCNAGFTVSCPAKINLFLNVLGKRSDGYHEIETVMQTVSLSDTLRIEPASDLSIKVTPPIVPCDSNNLVIRAAELLREFTGTRLGARIHLQKRIPVGGGLGGGSSDAAATLVGLAKLWQLRIGKEELLPLATQLGADVPFFLYGGTAACRGIGEIVTPLEWKCNAIYVLAIPRFSLSTSLMYDKLDSNLTHAPIDSTLLYSAVSVIPFSVLISGLHNSFDTVASRYYSQLQDIKHVMIDNGAAAAMLSGSGSTVFGACKDKDVAAKVAEKVSGLVERAEVVRPVT